MRITCPFCGERGVEEFAYHGDAAPTRPAATDDSAWPDYVYLRGNPAGQHRELWYHAGGCHAWLVVTRDTLSHAIGAVEIARDVALVRDAGGAG